MKTLYPLSLAATGLVLMTPLGAEDAKPPKLDVFALKVIPDAKYSVKLELRQLDAQSVTVEMKSQNGIVESSDDKGRLGKVRGASHFIGNGVFMVVLHGKGYTATQYWCFQPDGTAAIKEIPDRGEKQTAVRVEEKAPG